MNPQIKAASKMVGVPGGHSKYDLENVIVTKKQIMASDRFRAIIFEREENDGLADSFAFDPKTRDVKKVKKERIVDLNKVIKEITKDGAEFSIKFNPELLGSLLEAFASFPSVKSGGVRMDFFGKHEGLVITAETSSGKKMTGLVMPMW